jgi:capsular exopolysaccharide synthesis family protein
MSALFPPEREPRALPPAAEHALEGSTRSEHVIYGYGYPNEETSHFWDYWRVIARRRWTIITTFLVLVLAVTLTSFTTRPTYRATATLRIEKDQPRIVKFEEVVKEDPQQDYYQTQYRILQSRSLANRVIGLLQLDQHPEFAAPTKALHERTEATVREWLVRWIPVPPPPAPEAAEDLAVTSPLTTAFLSRLTVEPIRSSRLVKVAYDSAHPDLAARATNTVAEAFIAQQLDQKVEATRYATQFLAKQLEESRGKLEESEGKLTKFLNGHDILFVTGERGGQQQDLVTQQLGLISDALLKARGDRIAKESLVTLAATRSGDALPAVLQSPVIAGRKHELASLESEYRRLAQTFKPEYPRMQQLGEKIAEIRQQVRVETERVVAGLNTDYQAAVRTERELEVALTQQRRLARGLSDSMAEYSLLRREVDTNRELFASLLGRLRETQISAALFTSNISVVDRAEVPTVPYKPNKGQNILIACVAGLLGGVALAFTFEYLDTNLKDTQEVESVLRVPALGLVPARHALQGRRTLRSLPAVDGSPFALLAHAEVASVYSEAFRNLRTSLLYSTPDHPPKTIVVTSPYPEDGKTSLVTNLAITLAQLGSGEILIVDGDMRRPNLHNILGVRKAPGLSTYLTGQADLVDVISPTTIPNLSVIPAGRLPVNPSELVASARFKQALESLGDRFAHIIVDTGPLFGVSDAMIVSGQVEGVVLVLRHGRASRDAAQRAIRTLMAVRARLLGVILNDVEIGGSRYYGYYDYYASGGDHGHASTGEGHRDGTEGEPVAGDAPRVS